ncbi:unnamed protein product [Cuscuta campestris]|uniref:Uncharacterized protein n=1 Tax=Cuscuta campestris TaxID=132261 RepID=A0A484MRN1_9ASTE|nr:unnamed protein product [Cuscuta campestris]
MDVLVSAIENFSASEYFRSRLGKMMLWSLKISRAATTVETTRHVTGPNTELIADAVENNWCQILFQFCPI